MTTTDVPRRCQCPLGAGPSWVRPCELMVMLLPELEQVLTQGALSRASGRPSWRKWCLS